MLPTLFNPYGLQPTRIICPQDSPGKNTGMNVHALFQKHSRHRDQTHISCVSCIGRQVTHGHMVKKTRMNLSLNHKNVYFLFFFYDLVFLSLLLAFYIVLLSVTKFMLYLKVLRVSFQVLKDDCEQYSRVVKYKGFLIKWKCI